MRPIDKFILHVVHNWKNELNEAYSEKVMKDFIKKFSEEADDLNITISEDQLRKYIERFDVLKNSPKITEKDLNKWSLSQLIKLVTASKGAETKSDDEDQTPDVVYNENGIVIWNGSKEDNCITYGSGEKWCITRGSFGSYRYSSDRGYPTFYLAKNNNISDIDKLSFVAIQVRDVSDENKKYVYTNRKNDPYESRPMSFSTLLSEIPWLNDIPNIRSVLKYIPLNSKEQLQKKYQYTSISIREWIKLPFSIKQQYLVVRENNELFSDVSNKEFVEKYLPQYPQLAEFIAITPGILDTNLLLASLDKFSSQDRKSITANLRNKVDTKLLSSEALPFDVKKLLVALDKWNIKADERMYVTKDGSTIVKLKLGDVISMGLYQAEDDFPNVKLNQRTSKYILEYPELDKLPFNAIIKLATYDVIDKNVLNKIIEKAKSTEDSAIIVKKVEDGEILVDANSFSSYKIKDGKISEIPFNDEEVQKTLGGEKENTAFQQGAINIVKDSLSDRSNLPSSLDKDAFVSIVNATPYDKRVLPDYNGRLMIIFAPDGESRYTLVGKQVYDMAMYNSFSSLNFGDGGDWRVYTTGRVMDEASWKAYFAYLRNENKVYSGEELERIWRSSGNIESRKAWFRAQPPFSPTDRYAPVIGGNGVYYMVNKANPRESFKLSGASGKLVKANIPPAMARQLTSATPDEATPVVAAPQAVPGAPRRGRPAGVVQNVRAPRPAAPAAAGDINVTERMTELGLETAFLRLPRSDFRRLNVTNAQRENPNTSRGATRVNNRLGTAGQVGQVINVGPSKIYVIRLANQQIIATINVQPGNRNYVLFGNEQGNISEPMNSPAELMAVLQRRNLAEVRNYLVREYLANNPQHLDEVRDLIRQHVNETKKR